jgi:molybdopterin-guanine dinucleotide biosynthesis protein A
MPSSRRCWWWAGSARLLDALFEEVLVVGGEGPPEAPGRRAPDPPGPRCALRGLVGALAGASGERVLVLATDLPQVTPDLLLALVAWPERDAVVPRTQEGSHPLCAIYRRETTLAAARYRLEAGRLQLRGLLDELEVDHLEGADLAAVDPEGVALVNVNTPEDLARVRELAGC